MRVVKTRRGGRGGGGVGSGGGRGGGVPESVGGEGRCGGRVESTVEDDLGGRVGDAWMCCCESEENETSDEDKSHGGWLVAIDVQAVVDGLIIFLERLLQHVWLYDDAKLLRPAKRSKVKYTSSRGKQQDNGCASHDSKKKLKRTKLLHQ